MVTFGFMAAFTFFVVGLPTISAVCTELLRRHDVPPENMAKHRRGDLVCGVLWLIQTGLAWAGDGPLLWGWAYGTCAYAWSWWRGGGGDTTRRGVERGTGRVKAYGSRLIVVPLPAPSR